MIRVDRAMATNTLPPSVRSAGVAAAIAALITLPFVLSNYQILQATMVLIYAIALLGLNILTGYGGQLSLGHGAFFGIGAYVSAILLTHFGLPYWASVPITGFICLIGGILFGLPALRLEGDYLALATFALAVALPQILKNDKLSAWTGGVQGVVIDPVAVPQFLPLNSDQYLYLLCLAIAIAIFTLTWNLLRGRTGRAIVAIRDHPVAAASMGINTAFYKSMTFGVSAMFTGVAGTLAALTAQFIAPDSFSFFLSISMIVGVVVGGVATIAGAIFGAAFIQFVPDVAENISKAAPWAIYGCLLIGFMYLAPNGIVGLIKATWGALVMRRAYAGSCKRSGDR
jgi:branched-chain amino acid transport system permease protein